MAFWNFTYVEMGRHDLTAVIDHALEVSGAASLSYIAHSQGTSAMFAVVSCGTSGYFFCLLFPKTEKSLSLICSVRKCFSTQPYIFKVSFGTNFGAFFRGVGLVFDLVARFCHEKNRCVTNPKLVSKKVL
jgi:hypothetical protein